MICFRLEVVDDFVDSSCAWLCPCFLLQTLFSTRQILIIFKGLYANLFYRTKKNTKKLLNKKTTFVGPGKDVFLFFGFWCSLVVVVCVLMVSTFCGGSQIYLPPKIHVIQSALWVAWDTHYAGFATGKKQTSKACTGALKDHTEKCIIIITRLIWAKK